MTTATAVRAEQHIRMLAELADLTMVLCRVASLRACEQLDPAPQTPEQPDEPQPDPTLDAHIPKSIGQDAVLAFARLSRALRQTIALEARIAANRDRTAAAQRAGITWRPIPHLPHEIAKAHLADAVGAAARADPAISRSRTPESLLRHIDERLDADDIAEAIDDDEELAIIVATICNDLGIRFDPDTAPDDLLFPICAAIGIRQKGRGQGKPLRYRLDPSKEDTGEDDDPDEADDPPPPSRPRKLDA